ncbi:response regulator transcription factor [Alicyclobacillus fodiniaquatilis]|jgi:two-component system alkaline phosphatase synthesis response regulator PhoP|uniref:Response regulator transcription factor n=1 Tax=Alicyclobacillus fodiniaquatilis TaxID=1661150 RepID=A0ABW4JNZ8_9BACL
MDWTSQKPTVLIVDDEESIQKLVEFNFQRAGFLTNVVGDGQEAYARITADPSLFHIVILDVMLPGLDGLEVCKRLRRENIKIPIILLTAREEEVDRILGLELGADDYVTKPFSPRELVARARAVLRRVEALTEANPPQANQADAPITVGDIWLSLSRYEVTVRGEPIELTPKEFELLYYFIRNRDRVLTRDQLLEQVWGYVETPDTRVVDAHISHLREKIEENSKEPAYLLTVRGVGYRFADGAVKH